MTTPTAQPDPQSRSTGAGDHLRGSVEPDASPPTGSWYRRVSPSVPPPPTPGGRRLTRGRRDEAGARVADRVRRRPTARVFALAFVVLLALEVLGLRLLDRDPNALPASAAIATSLPAVQWALALPVGPATDVPTLTPEPTATVRPQPTWTPGPEASVPVVPAVDESMKRRLRAIYDNGQARGNRAQVFAKVGDSITISGHFLTDVGCGWLNYGDYEHLADTVAYFSEVTLPNPDSRARCGKNNSFTRHSVASEVGWMAFHVLGTLDARPAECAPPYDSPLLCEVKLTRPSIALIMFGTNEVHADANMANYEASLHRIVSGLEAEGVIPVLSTIPPRGSLMWGRSRVGRVNGIVLRVADKEGVPLWNYWRAMHDADLYDEGLAYDGIHPNAYHYGGSFSATGLRYGQNIRNLTALQVLDALRRVVIEDGPAQ